ERRARLIEAAGHCQELSNMADDEALRPPVFLDASEERLADLQGIHDVSRAGGRREGESGHNLDFLPAVTGAGRVLDGALTCVFGGGHLAAQPADHREKAPATRKPELVPQLLELGDE